MGFLMTFSYVNVRYFLYSPLTAFFIPFSVSAFLFLTVVYFVCVCVAW